MNLQLVRTFHLGVNVMTDLTVKENTELAEASMDSWGTDQDVTSQDVMISKIKCMQASSPEVKDRANEAQIGEFRDSVTGELFGNIDDGFDVIPFHLVKLWTVRKKIGDKFEYAYTTAITRENQHWKWEEHREDGVYRNEYTFLAYVLLPSEVEGGLPTPRTITFKRTSVKAGKKLFTRMFVQNKQMNKSPGHFVMTVSGKETAKDGNSWIILDVNTSRESTEAEVAEGFKMFQALKASDVKHEADDVAQADNSKYASPNMEF